MVVIMHCIPPISGPHPQFVSPESLGNLKVPAAGRFLFKVAIFFFYSAEPATEASLKCFAPFPHRQRSEECGVEGVRDKAFLQAVKFLCPEDLRFIGLG